MADTVSAVNVHGQADSGDFGARTVDHKRLLYAGAQRKPAITGQSADGTAKCSDHAVKSVCVQGNADDHGLGDPPGAVRLITGNCLFAPQRQPRPQ